MSDLTKFCFRPILPLSPEHPQRVLCLIYLVVLFFKLLDFQS
jgi:hypothetical protein